MNNSERVMNADCSQLNIGAIWIAEVVSSAGVGDVTGVASISSYTGELNTGLKATASGLKDVVRCLSAEAGRPMMFMSLPR